MLVFFFQAEDGIRDYKVTGVQTCALPISTVPPQIRRCREQRDRGRLAYEEGHRKPHRRPSPPLARETHDCGGDERSEERRVGKEWCSRITPEALYRQLMMMNDVSEKE